MQIFLSFCGVILISSLHDSRAGILRSSSSFVLLKTTLQDHKALLPRAPRAVSQKSIGKAVVERFKVTSHVALRSSRVLVESDVRNDENYTQEVSIELRLPKNAFVSNFSMVIDSVTYVGIVKEKKTAKAQYEAAIARGESAGLVSSKVREAQSFAVSVNVVAGTVVSFRLYYQELLTRKLGKYTHAIYANPGQLVDDLKIEVKINEPSGIETVSALPPALERWKGRAEIFSRNLVVHKNKTQAHVSFNPTLAQQKRLQSSELILLVIYDVTREELGGEVLIKDGYFVHYFATQNFPVIPKNVVFIIDKSGSMIGSKIKQTIKAFLTILDDLKEHDKFNIITFSAESQIFQRNEMVYASKYNIDRAKQFVQSIKAIGSTNLYAAIVEGLFLLNMISDSKVSSLEEAFMLILLTDGQPSDGVINTSDIRSRVREAVNGRYSLFCLGFGDNVDHKFLNKLANENNGLSRQIYMDSDSALQLKGFYDEVASPLLAHVLLKYKGVSTSRTTTLTFDQYFRGSEIWVAGQLDVDSYKPELLRLQALVVARSTEGDVRLESNGKEIEQTFVEEGFDMEKLWAYLTIKDLLKNKTLLNENETAANETDEEILRLSLKFNFVTPLTSMVVTKPDGETVIDEELKVPRTEPLHSSGRLIQRPRMALPASQQNSKRIWRPLSRMLPVLGLQEGRLADSSSSLNTPKQENGHVYPREHENLAIEASMSSSQLSNLALSVLLRDTKERNPSQDVEPTISRS